MARSCVNGSRPLPRRDEGRLTSRSMVILKSRRFFLSFARISCLDQIYLSGKQCQPTQIQWDPCAALGRQVIGL